MSVWFIACTGVTVEFLQPAFWLRKNEKFLRGLQFSNQDNFTQNGKRQGNSLG